MEKKTLKSVSLQKQSIFLSPEEQLKRQARKKESPFKQVDLWVGQTTEFPPQALRLLRLIEMSSNLDTSNKELIKELAAEKEIADKLINKSIRTEEERGRSKQRRFLARLQNSVQRLGFESIEQEVEESLVIQYAKIFVPMKNRFVNKTMKHLIRVAFFAKEISKLVGHEHVEQAFYAGFFHDIGKLVIALRDMQSFENINTMVEREIPEEVAELSALGFGHAELGAKLLEAWGVPEIYSKMSRSHKDLKAFVGGEELKLAQIVRAAVIVSHELMRKERGPKVVWKVISPDLEAAGMSLDLDTWDEHARAMIVKILALEDRIFVQRSV